MAEEERFELSIPCGIHAFQACALGHYATLPSPETLAQIDDFERRSGSRIARMLILRKRVTMQNMRKTYSNEQAQNPVEILRSAGYSYFKDPQSHEESFVVRLTPEFYPRFHVYVKHADNQVTFDLHLDQKKPSYGNNNLHSGEYDGPVVEHELKRIDSWVRKAQKINRQDTAEHDPDQMLRSKHAAETKSWWRRLLG